MSLFKIRTFWSVHCEEDSSYDQNSLLVTKLNHESDFLIVGSHSGILKVFKPSSDNFKEYTPADLLIETILKEPILQLSCGRFLSGSSKVQLAVLQPKSLNVYDLIVKEGATEHGVQNILEQLYVHKLQKLAFNFCVGPFGGVENRDFICVQSLDGLLTFFEQESFAFCCFLPDVLLPGPLTFVKSSDSFVTSNSNWHIISFRYKLLSEAGQNSTEGGNVSKFSSDWSFNLGEGIINLDVVQDTTSRITFIMVLGERSIFCLSDIGKLKYMKRLEFSPLNFINYFLNDRIMSLVVSETNNLLIYQNTSLKWCSQLHVSPISFNRGFVCNTNGVLVLLQEDGTLSCSYLGTEPSLFVAPPLALQDLDFEKAGQELTKLHKIVKNTYSNDIKVTNASTERELVLNVSVSPNLEENTLHKAINNKICPISIDIMPHTLFEEVQVTVVVDYPLKVSPQTEFFHNLSEKTTMTCCVFMEKPEEVSSLNVQVVASFISNLGVPRSVMKCAMLPLNLVLETCAPCKESECKVTLNINQSPVGLSALFPEYILSSNNNAIAFKNTATDGKVVTVLLAKSSERYRLQSDSFASLNLLVEEMVIRLKKHYSNVDGFSITSNSFPPVNTIVDCIKTHFYAQQKFVSLQNQITQLGAQLRLIQKRLIAKFKIKNPTSLANLELLLGDTYSEIMKLTEEFDEEKNNLVKSRNKLSSVLQLLINITKLMDVNNKARQLIESAFNPVIYDLDGQSWEDITDASFSYLLRTVLAKSEKDKLRPAQTNFEEVKDVSKIEKHLTLILERIPKGMLQESPSLLDEAEQENVDTEDNNVTESLPIGSKIGESSSQLLLSRRGLTKKS
ncbi:Protein PTHB1-like Protein [Tribolium castaneum]|uniref:Protein PTHB1-like Protein n=1 Tax=Tribolium castaneum TaxID=7070 RepID=D2CG54_TRICA|nr:PREDICTED: protein PTHB1 [Tribolium castaneum]EFA12827.1 Protein PTHB1-like Protein [Tribolium castaneum]|eukprot:XP_008196466.2 PREDICTED: protein PTHB1 [Tribolium castaneum]